MKKTCENWVNQDFVKKRIFFSGDVIIPPRKLHFEADNWADGVPAHVLREAPTMGISGSFKRALLERGCFFCGRYLQFRLGNGNKEIEFLGTF